MAAGSLLLRSGFVQLWGGSLVCVPGLRLRGFSCCRARAQEL